MTKYINVSPHGIAIDWFTVKPGAPVRDYPEGTKEFEAAEALFARGILGLANQVEAAAVLVEASVESEPKVEAPVEVPVEAPAEPEIEVSVESPEEVPAETAVEAPEKSVRKNAKK